MGQQISRWSRTKIFIYFYQHRGTTSNMLFPYPWIRQLHSDQGCISQICILRQFSSLNGSLLSSTGNNFLSTNVSNWSYTFPQMLKDLSMMYRALWDRRHEGATRISQCTRRVANLERSFFYLLLPKRGTTSNMLFPYPWIRQLHSDQGCISQICILRQFSSFNGSLLSSTDNNFLSTNVSNWSYTFPQMLKDLSMMYRALWDRRHEGATRISQCTRRVAPSALTYVSGHLNNRFCKLCVDIF